MKETEIPLLSLGHSCIDAIIAPSSVQFLPDNGVQLDMPIGESLLLRYYGEPIGWNEKRDATADLSMLLSLADAVHYGGGGLNSTKYSLQRGCRATLVDEVALPNAGLLTAMGGRYQSANPQNSPSVNLVVHDRATGNRICLRGPRRQTQGSTQPRMPEVGPHAALLVNSARDPRLVEQGIWIAEENGRPIVAIGNDSLPLASRLPLLFGRSQVAIENLSEFGQVAGALDIDCPADEATANLRTIAAAMLAVRHTMNSGHLAETLGRRGCLVLDARLGKVLHVCVGGRHRQELDLRLHRRVGGGNGADDMFAAAFTSAFVKMEARHSIGAVFFATRLATAEVCTALCPSLPVPESAIEMSFVEPCAPQHTFHPTRRSPCAIRPTSGSQHG